MAGVIGVENDDLDGVLVSVDHARGMVWYEHHPEGVAAGEAAITNETRDKSSQSISNTSAIAVMCYRRPKPEETVPET